MPYGMTTNTAQYTPPTRPTLGGAAGVTPLGQVGTNYSPTWPGTPYAPGTSTPPALPAPTNQNPYGGVRTSSSGGGSAVTPGMDQATFDAIMGMVGNSKPKSQSYTPVELPDWNAPEFRAWDDTLWTTAKGTINDQITAARENGGRTYADAMTELNQWQPSFNHGQIYNPSVKDSMAKMFSANGVDSNLLNQTVGEGVQADQAFGWVNSLLGSNEQMRQGSNIRALQGDERRFNESLGTEQRLMLASVDMALARAKAQYDKDKDERAYADAVRQHEIDTNEILQNNQGQNAVNQSNIASQNAWTQGMMSPIIDLIMSGYNSGGIQGLDVNAIMDMFK